jgi:ATP-dependent Lhr-like helicase
MMKKEHSLKLIHEWFTENKWSPFPFQEEVWELYLKRYNGLLNAPTGSGKTLALWLPVLIDWMNKHKNYKDKTNNGLQLLWLTPLKSLSKDIKKSLHRTCVELEIPWRVEVRTGDTATSVKQRQMRKAPEALITTPESLHLMLAAKEYDRFFSKLTTVIVDEWHELLGSKRGVQVELGLSRLKGIRKDLRIWGLSATIGNLDEALDVLMGTCKRKCKVVRAKFEKKMEVESILTDEVEKFPWAGHLGIKLLDKIIPIIERSKTTLLFTNTRSQTEIWYQRILNVYPDLAGQISLHHGSLDRDIRDWVESALHKEKLKLVVCTSSLDLGVDFRPVETVIQVGSPKGVARFTQRAGRSGHQPESVSKIYFVPTHSLELIESAALQQAMKDGVAEKREPILKPYDVLIQYLITLAVSDGFDPDKIYNEVKETFAYQTLNEKEWWWLLKFISTGGESLGAYEEYKRFDETRNNLFRLTNRRKALRHRLSIGTIVSDASVSVKFMTGGSLGSVEESFITKLKPGQVFSFAGRNLELQYLKGMTAYVKKAKKKSSVVPSWLGGRMPLSSQLSEYLRSKIDDYVKGSYDDIELKTIEPIMELQDAWSKVPAKKELLIEKVRTRDGHHIFFFPFEGRLVHEGMSALFAYRISKHENITFSIAMNDYGFELLSDKDVDIEKYIKLGLLQDETLTEDIKMSINSVEMAKRKFREIARIAGLIFQGYPGSFKTTRNIQVSSELLFDVFSQYEPESLLLKQAYEEMQQFQLEEARLRRALHRMQKQKALIKETHRPTPFAFPILVDSMREKLSSEKLEDRVAKMQLELEKYAERRK